MSLLVRVANTLYQHQLPAQGSSDITSIYSTFNLLPILASSSIQQRPVPAPVLAHHRTDEDFINRSLLDQIETDADTDPVFSSDSEAAGASIGGGGSGRNFGSSSSQSSVESSGVSFPYQLQLQTQQPQRSDSPTGKRSNMAYSAHNEQFMHTPQQSLYHNQSSEPPSEFAPFSDDSQTPGGPFDNNSYRNNPIFGPFLPSRVRQVSAAAPATAFGNDSNSYSHSQYNTGLTSTDVYGTHQQVAQMNQQQQQINGMRGFDYMTDNQGLKTNGKPMFSNIDPFSSGGATIMQGHQLNKQSQSQQQQQQLHSYVNQSFSNGMVQGQTHSQTPFGPHISTSNSGVMGGPNHSNVNGLGNVSVTTQQEEISTIFVVGFPEDMQEREFQNMFTFSSGFEAATLKIPNKDSTAYGANPSAAANAVSPAGRASFPMTFSYNASDPYNLITMNQGGVVDNRDGSSGWPSADLNDLAGGMNTNQPPSGAPRKQIIGFAKFRTRAEALAARDLLQGRRVDIEKGAILKAEMAKKNLHTKRGVGPLGAPLNVNVGVPGAGNNSMHPGMALNSGGGLGSISEGLSSMTGILSPTLGGPEALSARERELGTLGAMGLTSLTRRDVQDEDRELRRRREYGSVGALSNGLGALNLQTTRGARERLEEDEREREKRRKEKEAERTGRLRGGSQAAYDAFHPITIPQRQQMGSIMSPTEAMSAHPFATTQLFSPQESIGARSVDAWPIPSSQSQRLGSIGSGLPSVRATSLSITTSTGSLQQSSHEQSPTETADATRGGGSEHPSQEPELLSPSGIALSSQPSMSSLGSRSRPYSPTNEGVMSTSYLNKASEQVIQKGTQILGQNIPPLPNSVSSSVSGSRSSSSSSIDEEVSRTIGTIDVSSQQGTMSPQLPSPNSGASSGAGSRSNASDQNPPINTLYVGNLPTSPPPGAQPGYLEESLRNLFSRCAGYRKLCFRQKSNGPMCFVEFEDVNYASKALSELYGHNLNGLVKGGIRLSYSKNPLGVRTPTNVANGAGIQQGLHQFNASSFPSLQEALTRQQSGGLSIDISAIRSRREANEVTSPTQYFTSSPPPPRFFSPPPSSNYAFTGLANAPGLNRSNNISFTSTFSPFGSSTPPEMSVSQMGLSDSTDTVNPSNSLSTTPGLETTRSQ